MASQATIVLKPHLSDAVLTKAANYKLDKGHVCFWAIILYCLSLYRCCYCVYLLYRYFHEGNQKNILFKELQCNNISTLITF